MLLGYSGSRLPRSASATRPARHRCCWSSLDILLLRFRLRRELAAPLPRRARQGHDLLRRHAGAADEVHADAQGAGQDRPDARPSTTAELRLLLGLAARSALGRLFGVAAVVQAHAVRAPAGGRAGAARLRPRRPALVAAALLVVATYLAGFALHAVALWLLPLYLAQASISLSLPVTAIVSAAGPPRAARPRPLAGGGRGDRRHCVLVAGRAPAPSSTPPRPRRWSASGRSGCWSSRSALRCSLAGSAGLLGTVVRARLRRLRRHDARAVGRRPRAVLGARAGGRVRAGPGGVLALLRRPRPDRRRLLHRAADRHADLHPGRRRRRRVRRHGALRLDRRGRGGPRPLGRRRDPPRAAGSTGSPRARRARV